jgi:hypothetical protein
MINASMTQANLLRTNFKQQIQNRVIRQRQQSQAQPKVNLTTQSGQQSQVDYEQQKKDLADSQLKELERLKEEANKKSIEAFNMSQSSSGSSADYYDKRKAYYEQLAQYYNQSEQYATGEYNLGDITNWAKESASGKVADWNAQKVQTEQAKQEGYEPVYYNNNPQSALVGFSKTVTLTKQEQAPLITQLTDEQKQQQKDYEEFQSKLKSGEIIGFSGTGLSAKQEAKKNLLESGGFIEKTENPTEYFISKESKPFKKPESIQDAVTPAYKQVETLYYEPKKTLKPIDIFKGLVYAPIEVLEKTSEFAKGFIPEPNEQKTSISDIQPYKLRGSISPNMQLNSLLSNEESSQIKVRNTEIGKESISNAIKTQAYFSPSFSILLVSSGTRNIVEGKTLAEKGQGIIELGLGALPVVAETSLFKNLSKKVSDKIDTKVFIEEKPIKIEEIKPIIDVKPREIITGTNIEGRPQTVITYDVTGKARLGSEGRIVKVYKENAFQRLFNLKPTEIYSGNPYNNPKSYESAIGTLEKTGLTTEQAVQRIRRQNVKLIEPELNANVNAIYGDTNEILLKGNVRVNNKQIELGDIKSARVQPTLTSVASGSKDIGIIKESQLSKSNIESNKMFVSDEGNLFNKVNQRGKSKQLYEQASVSKEIGSGDIAKKFNEDLSTINGVDEYLQVSRTRQIKEGLYSRGKIQQQTSKIRILKNDNILEISLEGDSANLIKKASPTNKPMKPFARDETIINTNNQNQILRTESKPISIIKDAQESNSIFQKNLLESQIKNSKEEISNLIPDITNIQQRTPIKLKNILTKEEAFAKIDKLDTFDFVKSRMKQQILNDLNKEDNIGSLGDNKFDNLKPEGNLYSSVKPEGKYKDLGIIQGRIPPLGSDNKEDIIQKEFNKIRKAVNNKQIEILKPVQSNNDLPRTKQSSDSITIFKSKDNTDYKQPNIQRDNQRDNQRDITVQKSTQDTIQLQKPRQAKPDITIQINTPDVPNPEKPFKFLPPTKSSSKSKVKEIANDIFEVYARKKGQDISIGETSNKRQAIDILGKELKGTLRASGFIQEKRTGRKLDINEVNLGFGFRPSKKDSFRVVQTRSTRLGTRGEVSSIQQAKKSKGGNFNWLK